MKIWGIKNLLKLRLFTIDPELNNIKLKTITMSLKFQKVDWLFLGVVNDH